MRTDISLVSGACDDNRFEPQGKGQVWAGTAGTEGCLPLAVKSPAALGQPSHSLGFYGFLFCSTLTRLLLGISDL